MSLSLQHRRYMMGVVMFLMFMPPGMWVSSLPNILETYDAGWVLPFATALPAAGAIFSALAFGALSDQRAKGCWDTKPGISRQMPVVLSVFGGIAWTTMRASVNGAPTRPSVFSGAFLRAHA